MRTAHPSEPPTQPKTRHFNITYSLYPPTMPPIRTQSSRNLEAQEGRILLAIQAFKN
jgi:hypothetical protein